MRTVFLSSTGCDLHEHRERVYRAISGFDGWKCVRMEDFGARDWDADDFCRAKVKECDVLVGIVGHLFGSAPDGSDRSYTQREYDAAKAEQIPRLMFLAPADFTVPANLIEPDEERKKQKDFRDQVSGERIRDTFTSPDDLAERVGRAMRNWEREAESTQRRRETTPAGRIMALPPQPHFAHTYPMQANFTGRVKERQTLTKWLTESDQPVFEYIAIGGMGKSALTWAWLQRDVLGLPLPGSKEDAPDVAATCRVPDEHRPEGVMWWSFYERDASFAAFVDETLIYLSGGKVNPADVPSMYEKITGLLTLLQQRRILLVLDGFERELRAYASMNAAYQGDAIVKDDRGDYRTCVDRHAADFLQRAASLAIKGRILITSRLAPRELDELAGCQRLELNSMDPEDAVSFFQNHGIKGTCAEIQAACVPYGYHPLALRLLAGVIVKDKRDPGDIKAAKEHPVAADLVGKEEHHILQVAYDELSEPMRELLSRFAAFRSPMTYDALTMFNTWEAERAFDNALDELVERGLLLFDRQKNEYDLHPIVRQYAYVRLIDKEGVHARLRDYFADVPTPDESQSINDLNPVIELYHHTVRAGRFDDAIELYRDRLGSPLYYHFAAYQTCIDLLRALFPDGESQPPRVERERMHSWALNALAIAYERCGESRRAALLQGRAAGVAEGCGEMSNVATCLHNAGDVQVCLGQLERAERDIRRSLELFADSVEGADEAAARNELGRILAVRGAFRESEEEFSNAQDAIDEYESTYVTVVRVDRAEAALLHGKPAAALDAARQARALADEVARTISVVERDFVCAEWLIGAALVALADEEMDNRVQHLTEAEVNLTVALTRCRRVNLIEVEAKILLACAKWHRAKGDRGRARADAGEALKIANRCEHRLQQADIHNFLALLAIDEGDPDTAHKEAEIGKERAWCDGPPYCYKPALDEAERILAELQSNRE